MATSATISIRPLRHLLSVVIPNSLLNCRRPPIHPESTPALFVPGYFAFFSASGRTYRLRLEVQAPGSKSADSLDPTLRRYFNRERCQDRKVPGIFGQLQE